MLVVTHVIMIPYLHTQESRGCRGGERGESREKIVFLKIEIKKKWGRLLFPSLCSAVSNIWTMKGSSCLLVFSHDKKSVAARILDLSIIVHWTEMYFFIFVLVFSHLNYFILKIKDFHKLTLVFSLVSYCSGWCLFHLVHTSPLKGILGARCRQGKIQ